MNNTPAVSLKNVSHRYGNQQALDEISLRVSPGILFGILGPNGAGKSTLFQLISTLLPVQEGTVEVFGISPNQNPETVREQIGLVFQSAHVDPVLTGEENLDFHRSLYGENNIDVPNRKKELLEKFELDDRKGDPVKEYSGGMRRRLELVMALLHRPRLLILDEPTSGLDLGSRKQLWELVQFMVEQEDLTVLLATHDMEEAEICDRVAIIDEGDCVAEDNPKNLKRKLGGDVLDFTVDDPDGFVSDVEASFSVKAATVDGRVLIETDDAHELIPDVIETFPGRVQSVTLRQPTLGDVFLKLTGKELTDQEQ